MRILTLSLLLSQTIGCSLMSDINLEKFKGSKIEVQGHRGARSRLPENTLPAFEYAMKIGVDTLELDLGVTKDNAVIVIHDQKINSKICQYKNGQAINGEKWIHSMTLKEIKDIDCGSKVNPRFPEQKTRPGAEIPTLDEVFQLAKPSKLHFNIETKSKPELPTAQPSPELFAKLVLEIVHQHGLEKRVTIQSFDHRTLVEVKKQAPKIQLAALFEDKPDNWVTATKMAKADIVSPYFKLISKEDVQEIHAAGLKVIPWTPNEQKHWLQLIELGVDGIITDDPEPLLKLLGR